MMIEQGLSNRQIKFIRKLNQKKFRQKFSAYIVEGTKMAEEAITTCPELIELFCATRNWYDQHLELLPGDKSFCYLIEDNLIEEVSNVQSHQGVLLAVKKRETAKPSEVDQSLFIFLDAVQDPGNVGTIIRTADWFGHRRIYYGPGTVDPYNSKVVQASMGSLFRMHPLYVPTEEIENRDLNMTWTAASLKGNPMSEWNAEIPELLVIGNEGAGLSEAVAARVDREVCIPGVDLAERAESLNASVACGILISHWTEKTKEKTKRFIG